MTLKEFAAQSGINYATAKTWRARGRILETAPGCFELAGPGAWTSPPAESGLQVETLSETRLSPETKVSTLRVGPLKPDTLILGLAETLTESRFVSPAESELETLRDRVAEAETRLAGRLADIERRLAYLETVQDRRAQANWPGTPPADPADWPDWGA